MAVTVLDITCISGPKWLDADAFQAFKSSGDIYNKELAAKFRKYVLSEGGYADPMQQYIKFRGQEPSEDSFVV